MKFYTVIKIINEYAQNGELFDFIINGEQLNDVINRTLFLQVISAVSYMHEQKLAHRDLKPENILLDADYQVKVADFGFAKKETEILKTYLGTKSYMAPEIHIYKGT